MDQSHGPVWVVAEQRDGVVIPVSLQLIGHARKLADTLRVPLEALLLSDAARTGLDDLGSAGLDRIYLCATPERGLYASEVFAALLSELAVKNHPEILLIGSTSLGRELAPLIAARLCTGLTAHCVDLRLNEQNILEATVPAYGVALTIICPEKRPQMATVAQGVFPTPEPEEARTAEVVDVALPADFHPRIQTLEIMREEPKGLDLETAPSVVAGGAGAVDAQGWKMIETLADELNAAVGSTRPAVDEGWTELDTMIGQSGKMVSPKLYIAAGLSGELQHMVGIKGSPLMIAINNDPKAPVFAQVDFGIVEDCTSFLPLLIEKIKEHKSHQDVE